MVDRDSACCILQKAAPESSVLMILSGSDIYVLLERVLSIPKKLIVNSTLSSLGALL